MNRPFVKWLLAISLSLNAGIIVAVVAAQMRTAPPAGPASTVNLPDYLGLDAQQRARWQQIEKEFLQDLSVNWQQIRSRREALVRQIFSEAPARAAIDAEQAQIATLQDSQQRRVIRQLLAERDLLDAQQRQKLMLLLLSRYTQEASEEEQLHRH
ncbi:MAG TPA: periplasmic heavy metal sensor [Burkholderiaceae bacterium]|nr:periplasmic heavy metal sensor [Burkholderiaceae bacterium]